MEQLFVLEIREFLASCSLKYDFKGNGFYLPDSSLLILPVPLYGGYCLNKEYQVKEKNEINLVNDNREWRQIRVYEDLWFTKGDIIRNRLRALLGRGNVVFARKCKVAKIDVQMARAFLENNHILGYSRAKYFYGLFYSEQLVAVAAFSASRPMKRQSGEVNSFEWVRYASVNCTRIIGGMGRLLGMFVEQEKPQEVMSYADLDWGSGNAYKKLGFELIGKTAPVKFMIDPKTYQRYSLKKLLRDRKYNKNCTQSNQEHNNLNNKNLNNKELNDKIINEKEFILLLNSGNLKFLWSFPLL